MFYAEFTASGNGLICKGIMLYKGKEDIKKDRNEDVLIVWTTTKSHKKRSMKRNSWEEIILNKKRAIIVVPWSYVNFGSSLLIYNEGLLTNNKIDDLKSIEDIRLIDFCRDL